MIIYYCMIHANLILHVPTHFLVSHDAAYIKTADFTTAQLSQATSYVQETVIK